MNKINPNHPATPTPFLFEDGFAGHATGLTIRAELAARAMQAIVTSIDSEANYMRLKHLARMESLTVSQWIAREACKQADALIAELNKTPAGSDTGQK